MRAVSNKIYVLFGLYFLSGILVATMTSRLFGKSMHYITPSIAVDIIVECPDNKIALIQRKNHPLGVAIPGGFVEIGDTVEYSAIRELEEETSLSIGEFDCEQYHVYSDPKRDPRGHTISVAFICPATDCSSIKANDDAAGVKLFAEKDIPWQYMVFDHGKVLQDYYNHRWPRFKWLKE